MKTQHNKKMKLKWEGPFLITEVLGPVTYHLQLPVSWWIHNVFNATLLKPFKENKIYGPNFPEPPSELENNEEVYKVDSILNYGKRGWGYQCYIKWKGYPISEASWEPEQAFSDDRNMLSLYKQQHQLWTLKKDEIYLETNFHGLCYPFHHLQWLLWWKNLNHEELCQWICQISYTIGRLDNKNRFDHGNNEASI